MRKGQEVFTTSGTYPWSFVTQIFLVGIAYGVYISQLIRYSRACGYYQDFLDRGLLLTRKKKNKRTNNDLQNIHIKLKIE
jgi:hypothetical protein